MLNLAKNLNVYFLLSPFMNCKLQLCDRNFKIKLNKCNIIKGKKERKKKDLIETFALSDLVS